MRFLQHFSQKGGGTTGKPVVLKHSASKHVQDTERIVHAFLTEIVEMVSVIHTGEIHHAVFSRQTVPFCQPFQFRDEIGFNFQAGHATKSIVLWIETYIYQLVEYTHLSKFGNSGDKDETQPWVSIFQYSIESSKHFTEFALQFRVVHRTKQWFNYPAS